MRRTEVFPKRAAAHNPNSPHRDRCVFALGCWLFDQAAPKLIRNDASLDGESKPRRTIYRRFAVVNAKKEMRAGG